MIRSFIKSLGKAKGRNDKVDEFDPETLESALAGGAEPDLKQAVSELRNDEIEDYLNDSESDAMASDGI